MKHKTELRKGLVRLVADADIPENADVISNGKVIGRTHTSAGNAHAYLRYDRADGDISVNDIPVTGRNKRGPFGPHCRLGAL